jgi:hypothetical protein
MIRRILAIVACAGLLPLSSPDTLAAAPPPDTARDVTATTAGQDAAGAAAARFTNMGVSTLASDLVVYEIDTDGGVLIGPKGGSVLSVRSNMDKDGSPGFEVRVQPPPDDPTTLESSAEDQVGKGPAGHDGLLGLRVGGP